MTKTNKAAPGQPRRGLREAVDGPLIRRWYARMPTAELARQTGLTVKQITNYVYRHNTEPWARKLRSVVSAENSVKGKKGGRQAEKIGNKKLILFFLWFFFRNLPAKPVDATKTGSNET
jgi:hypothetical protein